MLSTLVRTPRIADLSRHQAGVLTALRLWAVMMRMRWCPVEALVEHIGSRRAAAHFQLLMEEIGAVWPEPFCVSPPCSPRLSHDEATFVEMFGFVTAGDLPGFDRLLADLLCADVRERLYASSTALVRSR